MNQINFFTCCNKIYNNFIPLFILSNLYHNDNSFVEIGTDDENYEPISKAMDFLKKIYEDRFLVRQVNFNYVEYQGKKFNTIPNSIRFLTEPKIKTEYVYISDVDIITLQRNICEIHINNMKKTGLPYSNIVRPIKNIENEIKRLTGLHFTPHSNYYPIANVSDVYNTGILSHDEGLLYKIVEKKYPKFNYDEVYRPVHGIHVSLNREPMGKIGWGINNWKTQWLEFRNLSIFNEIEKVLPKFIIEKINIIDNHAK